MKKTTRKKGQLAMIQTAEGYFFFLTPIKSEDYNPAIVINGGVCGLPCYVIPSKIGGAICQGLVIPGMDEMSLCWQAALVEALSVMNRVWEAISEKCMNLKQREGVAKAIVVSPHAFTAMINTSKVGDMRGYPRTAEGFVKSILVLTYWAGLRRHREQTPQRGMAWQKAAKILNHDCHILFPDWAEWGWKDFTPRALRARVELLDIEFSPIS